MHHPVTDLVYIGRALISVSDKTGLLDLARELAAKGVELISTGGTSGMLRSAGLAVRDVAEVTGFPEMMDGRVKTLHPNIHGGLLALRDDDEHLLAMAAHGIEPIDLLIVNLYPFEETVAKGADHATCIENIDIGGPAMIRAASKNHKFVTVVTDPADYGALTDQLRAHDGATTLAFRQKLALTAYARTAAYDTAVSTWLAAEIRETTPRYRSFAGKLAQPLRYGENPHQAAAFYTDGSRRPGVATARAVAGQGAVLQQHQRHRRGLRTGGRVCARRRPGLRHHQARQPLRRGARGNPARRLSGGLCLRPDLGLRGHRGTEHGPGCRHRRRDLQDLHRGGHRPGASDEAKAIFAAKKNLRLLTTEGLPDPAAPGLAFKQVSGGLLVQDRDSQPLAAGALKVVTKRAPSEAEMADLLFAWKVAKHVKSNAIVYVKGGATVGVGAGQMSRVDSTRIAARKAEDMAAATGLADTPTKGSVVASDAFFPFPDGLLTAAAAGATAVIQPGGSMNDQAVIDAANAAGLAMVFTGQRHFRH